MATLSSSVAGYQGWSDEQLAGITAPTLIAIGDYDFTTVEHAVLMLRLIPGSQLAVLPAPRTWTRDRPPGQDRDGARRYLLRDRAAAGD
jgi:pimeloyl-ACP methyl ester carboxylesterase